VTGYFVSEAASGHREMRIKPVVMAPTCQASASQIGPVEILQQTVYPELIADRIIFSQFV
jgi:hypothetical protein